MIVKQYDIGNFNINKLDSEIRESNTVNSYDGVSTTETKLNVYGSSIADEPALDLIIDTHVNENSSEQIYLTIYDRKYFCDELMDRFKKLNINSQITAAQGFWLHTRLRQHTFTFYGNTYTLDIMNLIVSGDVELGCIAMMNFSPDSMEEPYHFFTQQRIDWLVNEMKKYLGWP